MDGMIPVAAALIAFVATALSGKIVIPILRKLKYGQTILEIGPKWHKKKQGIPTMGGIMFIIGIIIAVAAAFAIAPIIKAAGLINESSASENIIPLISGIGLALGMGAIGFIDDYIKVVKKRNLGLSARQKTMLQLIVAVAYLISIYMGGMTYTKIPFIGTLDVSSGIGLVFWPIALIFIYGFVNAVNLTDGIDGLASSVTFVVAVFFMVLSIFQSRYGFNMLSAALAGGCVGFLVWNMNPAKVFMGDTGSMFLGGMVVALSFGSGYPILLFLSGIIYLVEAMSVVIQVTYYKRTKKRLFKMSPIHHHFEMSGWSENKIVLTFSAITVIGSLIAFLLYLLGAR